MSEPSFNIDESGCWIWTGPLNGDQRYGKWHGTTAHRAMYAHLVAPVQAGMHLDHLCRKPLCVNPAHLEVVSPEENRRRQIDAKKACKRGHPFDATNTRWRGGDRICRTCSNAASRRYKARRRAQKRAD